MKIKRSKICKICNTDLDIKTNWSRQKYHDYRCDACLKSYSRNWWKTSPKVPALRKKAAAFTRKHYLGMTVNGKSKYVKVQGKRAHPKECEMCQKVWADGFRANYHHWNDADFSLGIWVCNRCHRIAHGVDSGMADVYRQLKDWISKKVA